MPKPKHIILLRHGESQANVDSSILHIVPDHKIELSSKGREQATQVGKELKNIIGDSKVLFYVSPYKRTQQTFEYARQAFDEKQVTFYVEPRLREQDFGNFQDNTMAKTLQLRSKYGRFFYRFPEGESGADVYDRISTFLETIHRVFERNDCEHIVIVSHGLTIRLFLMRWFHWTVEEFESYENPKNCEYYIMELCGTNKLSLKYNLKTQMKKYSSKPCNKTVKELISPFVYGGIAVVLLQYFSKLMR